jgi:hypothetical protein
LRLRPEAASFAPCSDGIVMLPIVAARNVPEAVNQNVKMRPAPLREFPDCDPCSEMRFEHSPAKILQFFLCIPRAQIPRKRNRQNPGRGAVLSLEKGKILARGLSPFPVGTAEFYSDLVPVVT